MKNKSMKIRVGERESCWAERLSDNLAKINNIPFSGKYNLHDIVEYTVEDGIAIAGKIVNQRWECLTYLQYKEVWQFHRMNSVFRLLGCACEGMTGPHEGRPGYMMVSYDKPINPKKIAEGMGISQKKEKAEKNA